MITLVQVNKNDITNLVKFFNQISEIRLNTEANEFFLSHLNNQDQKEWIKYLLDRIIISEEDESSTTSICILDTGVNPTHPIIEPFIKSNSRIQSVVAPIDSVNDLLGHGTQMAGVAIFNDLKSALEERKHLNINHSIESVKILPDSGENEESLFGAVTSDAVMSAEIESPYNNKIYCMAITSDSNGPIPGSPTQWSATIDSLSHDENNNRRLFLISGGNIHPLTYSESGIEYPDFNSQYEVENPGQSWNALTIGAYNKNSIFIDDDKAVGFEPVSKNNELSPYSSTSVSWDPKTPIKPEVLFDGGNMIKNNNGDYDSHDNHSLLTANHKIQPINPKYFSTINATSSATAQASNFTARLWNEYPELWPETIRGLVVHSGNWTKEMISQFKYNDKKSEGIRNLIRHTGYGVPNYNNAVSSQNNSVNLIAESEIQPYIKEGTSIKYNEANFYKIPWPKDELELLDNEKIRLKVTLSYFIEPSPNKVGWTNKYIYPSYRFAFDIIRPTESLEEFQARISKELRYDDYKTTSSSLNWFIGRDNRNNGSIHSDFIEDTAINLSDTNYIVVYPQGGWWKERKKFKRFNNGTRYSLILTLETIDREVDINLYQPIMNQIEGLIEV